MQRYKQQLLLLCKPACTAKGLWVGPARLPSPPAQHSVLHQSTLTSLGNYQKLPAQKQLQTAAEAGLDYNIIIIVYHA